MAITRCLIWKSSVVWENLEQWVRGKIQGYLQDLLEDEMTVFLGNPLCAHAQKRPRTPKRRSSAGAVAAALLDRDWERMVAFYRYPKEHWVHLRTTNPIEIAFRRCAAAYRCGQAVQESR